MKAYMYLKNSIFLHTKPETTLVIFFDHTFCLYIRNIFMAYLPRIIIKEQASLCSSIKVSFIKREQTRIGQCVYVFFLFFVFLGGEGRGLPYRTDKRQRGKKILLNSKSAFIFVKNNISVSI